MRDLKPDAFVKLATAASDLIIDGRIDELRLAIAKPEESMEERIKERRPSIKQASLTRGRRLARPRTLGFTMSPRLPCGT